MDALIPVLGFLIVAAITPGPNNFIVLAAAARGGFAAALPVIAGVLCGAVALLSLVWAGAGVVLDTVPGMRLVLVGLGALYLVHLGVGSIRSAGHDGADAKEHDTGLPSTMLGVAAFQFANPKGWMLMLTATAAVAEAFTGFRSWAVLVAMTLAVMAACLSTWAVAGAALGEWLKRPRARLWFGRSMGALLVLSAVLLLVG